MMIDLTHEMADAILRIGQHHMDRIAAQGVSNGIAAPTNGLPHRWGVARVCPDGDNQFYPSDDGKDAFVVFARHRGRVQDLIAFGLQAPSRWRWRVGGLSILNEDALDIPRFDGRPPELVATPIDWLRSGCETLCILDWCDHGSLRRFAMEAEIVAPKPIASRLAAILRTPIRMPRFITPEVYEHGC
jgi:hypothetical protein